MPCTQVNSGLRTNSLTDDALSAQSLSPVRQMVELGHSQPQPPPHHLLSPGEPGDPKGPGPPTPRESCDHTTALPASQKGVIQLKEAYLGEAIPFP